MIPGERRREGFDVVILGLAVLLLALGLIMVYSASAIWADQRWHSPLLFIKRQCVWALIGLTAMAALSRMDYNRLKEWVWPALVVTVLALIGALFTPPPPGTRANRWLLLGSWSLQPSEFAKLTAVLFLAYYLDRKRSKVSDPVRGLLIPVGITGILLFLIGIEPDIGTPILMFAVTLELLFMAGARMRHVAAAAALALPIVAYELIRKPYRLARIAAFLLPAGTWIEVFASRLGVDPSRLKLASVQEASYQVEQSVLAIGSGGWFGRGFGASQLKLMYLPTPHTDFIFPVLCEELGFFGGLAIILLFALLLIRGFRVARHAPNLFGTLLAGGITLTICLQAFFNISMSVGLLPTKGIPLPLVSFGGSSLLATLAGIGIVLNISRHAQQAQRAGAKVLSVPQDCGGGLQSSS